MNTLHILEEKVTQLAELIHTLRKKNSVLTEENATLIQRIHDLEEVALNSTNKVEEEKALTKEVVDELIKNIDTLVEHEELA